MHIQCPQCGASGKIPDKKIPAKGTKIICPKCKTPFFVQKKTDTTAGQATTPDAAMYHNEGVQLLKKRQIEAAIEKLNKAIQINPNYNEAYRHLGLAYGQKKLWTDATQVLQKAITYKPDDLLALKNLGVAYLQQKQFTEAEQVLQQALQYAPDDEKARAYLAKAVQGKEQKQGANETHTPSSDSNDTQPPLPSESKAAVQRNPVEELLDKGVVCLDNAQYNKAIDAFQEVTRLVPDSSDGYYGLGLVYEQRQDWVNAISAYRKAVELNPDDTPAKESLRFAKKQKRKFKFKLWKK